MQAIVRFCCVCVEECGFRWATWCIVRGIIRNVAKFSGAVVADRWGKAGNLGLAIQDFQGPPGGAFGLLDDVTGLCGAFDAVGNTVVEVRHDGECGDAPCIGRTYSAGRLQAYWVDACLSLICWVSHAFHTWT